jgi:hypothetical protein
MRRSVNTATAALTENKNSSQLDRRAWLTVTGISVIPTQLPSTLLPPVQIAITNSGKTPAINAICIAESHALDGLPDTPRPKLTNSRDFNLPAILAPGFDSFKCAPEQETAPLTPTKRLFFFGTVTYADIENRQHWTDFCFVLKRAVAGRPPEFEPCGKWNDIDR